MTPYRRIAAVVLCSGLLATTAWAQAPAGRGADESASRARRVRPAVQRDARDIDDEDDDAYSGERSVLRSTRRPYHSSYGWRNPGGIGRKMEFYPPGDRFQNERRPTPVATFQNGEGPPGRAEQLAAQQLNIQKYQAIQGHIDRYGRPLGFGWGFGGFGFGFGFR